MHHAPRAMRHGPPAAGPYTGVFLSGLSLHYFVRLGRIYFVPQGHISSANGGHISCIKPFVTDNRSLITGHFRLPLRLCASVAKKCIRVLRIESTGHGPYTCVFLCVLCALCALCGKKRIAYCVLISGPGPLHMCISLCPLCPLWQKTYCVLCMINGPRRHGPYTFVFLCASVAKKCICVLRIESTGRGNSQQLTAIVPVTSRECRRP
jgi:hypothetical protein